MRLLKFLVVIVILAFLALTGYAYLGDMAPRQHEMRQPVALDTGDQGSAAPAAATTTGGDAPTADDSAAGADDADPESGEDTDANGLD